MKKKDFLKKLAKIFKKKSMDENDRVELDSLNFLEILELNDLNFKIFLADRIAKSLENIFLLAILLVLMPIFLN